VCGGHRLAYAHAYVQQALDRKRVTMSATRGCCVASKVRRCVRARTGGVATSDRMWSQWPPEKDESASES
jgi:hypothetical protein